MTVPLYCPFWGPECKWSADTTSGTSRRHLETHLKIVHRGQAIPVARVEPARPAVLVAVAPVGPRPMGRPPQYTRESAIEALKAGAEELGRVPSAAWWGENHRKPTESTINRLFGGWSAGLLAAGLTPRVTRPIVTREECVEAIRVVAGELGRPPRSKEWPAGRPVGRTAIFALFGTWGAALHAAGLSEETLSEPGPGIGVRGTAPADAPGSLSGESAEARGALVAFLQERCSLPELRGMLENALEREVIHLRIAQQARNEVTVLQDAIQELAA